MKIEFNYGNGVLTLPLSVAEANDATATDYRVLMCLAANPSFDEGQIASESECSSEDVRTAIAFWRGAGVLSVKEGGKSAKKTPGPSKPEAKEDTSDQRKVMSVPELPHYTTDELNSILEKRKDAHILVDECERIVGKMFSPAEVNTVLGLLDYLMLDTEYILVLFAYCAKIGKKSVRYIEKTALSFHDRDITTAELLQEYIKRKDEASAVEGRIRRMLGIGERALSAKESKYFEKWVVDYKFTLEMIQKAYEITVDAGKTKITDYMNGILEAWHAEGIDTLEKVEKRNAEHSASVEKPHEGSFDTEDFFNAAVQRSLGKDCDMKDI